MNIGDSVYWNGEVGIIMQMGNPHGNRQIKIEWMVSKITWEYVADVRRMRQLFLDILQK